MQTRLIQRVVLLVLIALICKPMSSRSQTISGAIASDTTWTTGTVIADSVYVPSGRTLTIQPGTVIKFNAGKMLVIAGKLIANGTVASQITFTSNAGSPAAGDWRGIELQASSDIASIINYCVVEYGGSGSNGAAIFYKTGAPNINISNSTVRFSSGNGINPRSSAPRISTSTFRQNGGYGIFADLSLNFTVDSCTVSNNTNGGIFIAVNSSAIVTNCSVDSNGTGIFVGNSSAPTIQMNNIRRNNVGIQFTGVGATQPTISQNTITNSITWGFLNTSTSTTVRARQNYWGNDAGPFHASLNPTGLGDNVSDNVDFQPWTILTAALPVTNVTANIATTSWTSGVFWVKNNISVSGTLTISPGVIVKFAPNARLTVTGTLKAVGTAGNLIVFTSEKDDPYGGDTNGDVGATIPGRGDWDMVWLNGGGNSSDSLMYTVFRFGGSSGNGTIRIDATTPTISNLSSTQSSNYGLFLYSNADPVISISTFGSNSLDGVLVEQGSDPTFYRITSVNNGRYGIFANSGSARFTVRKSKFTGNSYGIVADAGSGSATLVSLDSSDISNNINGGLYCWYGTGAQAFAYNRIANNGGYGLWCFNINDLVTIVGDTIVNNANDGIVTSKASILNNVIQNNRYPIALLGRVNTTYSGNTISGNTYNNALALRVNRGDECLLDTLKAVFPSGMTSGTYVLVDFASGIVVNSGTTLVIQPGVIVKMDAGAYFRVDGTLIANGTAPSPIVFTSYRDAAYGGKTNLGTDNAAPAANDWRYMRVRTAAANGTMLSNVIFKYGGQDGVGNLWIEGGVVFTNPITNIISRKSSSYGMYIYDSQVILTNSTVDSNGSYGIYIAGNRPSDVTVRGSTIQDNNGEGLRAVNNATFREVSNCIVRRNNGWGIGTDNGTLDQVFQGNTISNNTSGGIYNNSTSIPATNLQYIGNTIQDNTADGILSTRARFIDNTIQRNRYPLAVWRRTGNIYVDNNGVDGNIITGNTYNNAIAIWDGALSDTLKANFPLAITSKTYVAIYNFQVDGGTSLVIEPGVKVKFQEIPANTWHTFNVYGTLTANGTSVNPIIFTSWRDSTVGGKTTALNDYTPPNPADWYYVGFRNGSGASVVRNCQFKYGGRDGQQAIFFDTNLGGLTFSNNLVRRSSTNGIFVNNTPLTIDSTTVDSCGYNGIRVNAVAANNLILRQSKLLNNGQYGLWVQSPAKLSVVTNCDISRNGYSGIMVENTSVPLSFIGNTVTNNRDHGVYVVALNDVVDSLLTFAGNKIRSNGIIGLASSRAYVSDDSITGNRYAIGVVGQISLASTGTANGNVYSNNTITGNTYNDILVSEETAYGRLGYSYPAGYTSKVVAVRGGLLVPTGTTMTISPGTTIKFPKEYSGGAAGGNGRFRVDGVLKSEGTTSNKIVFTSWKDDTYGGDSNGDVNATVPGLADWDMLYLNGSSNNNSHLFNTIVRYGGNQSDGEVRLDNNNAPIDSCFISFSYWDGIRLFGSSSPAISSSEIHDNRLAGIAAFNTSNPAIHLNNIYANGTGLENQTANLINATNNYWGASTGPYKNQGSPQNLSGTGNRINLGSSGDVTFQPFFTARSGLLVGDVSQNGSISAFDAALVLRHVVALDTLQGAALDVADVTGDGTVSALDASYVLRYVVGLTTGFPRLGKLVAGANPAFEFKTVRISPDELQLVLWVDGSMPIYSTEIHLAYDSTTMTPTRVQTTSLSDSMMVLYSFRSSTASIALAGTTPITQGGNVVTIVFNLKNSPKTMQLDFTRFVLNELNLTSQIRSVVVSVESPAAIPASYGLGQNYPNPFNPMTTINYQLPFSSLVKITVYDMLGQEVRTIVDGEQQAGYHHVTWDGTNDRSSSVASGVYFYRIEARSAEHDHFTMVRKMLMLK